jgi:hypothetical protein
MLDLILFHVASSDCYIYDSTTGYYYDPLAGTYYDPNTQVSFVFLFLFLFLICSVSRFLRKVPIMCYFEYFILWILWMLFA